MVDKTTLEAYQELGEAWVEVRQELIEAFQVERILGWLGLELKEEYRQSDAAERRKDNQC